MLGPVEKAGLFWYFRRFSVSFTLHEVFVSQFAKFAKIFVFARSLIPPWCHQGLYETPLHSKTPPFVKQIESAQAGEVVLWVRVRRFICGNPLPVLWFSLHWSGGRRLQSYQRTSAGDRWVCYMKSLQDKGWRGLLSVGALFCRRPVLIPDIVWTGGETHFSAKPTVWGDGSLWWYQLVSQKYSLYCMKSTEEIKNMLLKVL